MELQEQIAARAKEIHTDGYPMSIGEILSLYREGDIEIHPEFQRIFRWTPKQKSRLIESILLGIPVPPIFVSQRADGVWDVIDGVQRLSTVFEFVGVYKDQDGVLIDPLVLSKTEYLPALADFTWDVTAGTEDEVGGALNLGELARSKHFDNAMQRDFKRAKLEFRIIRKESDSNAKYDLFQRLNSGTALSAQEARNCLLVMISPSMFNTLSGLAELENFRDSVVISDRKESQAYRQELVLRFFSQVAYDGTGSELNDEYGEYLTTWMRDAAATTNEKPQESPIKTELFRETFSLISSALGEDAFRRFDGSRHLGPFSIASFEFVSSGVAANRAAWVDDPEGLAERIRSIWEAPDFRNNSGTGVSPRRRVPQLVTISRNYFAR